MQPNISRRSVTSLLCGVLVLAVCTSAVARTGINTSGSGADNDPIDATLLSTTADWVVAENRKPGTRAWRIPKSTPSRIEGFADHVSAKQGNRVHRGPPRLLRWRGRHATRLVQADPVELIR